jgi:S1-C subfamily serine protease
MDEKNPAAQPDQPYRTDDQVGSAEQASSVPEPSAQSAAAGAAQPAPTDAPTWSAPAAPAWSTSSQNSVPPTAQDDRAGQGDNQGQAYGERPTYGQNQAYGQNQTYNQDQPYSQNQTYGQDQDYGQNQTYGQDQDYGQNQAYNQGQPYSQNQAYASSQPFQPHGTATMPSWAAPANPAASAQGPRWVWQDDRWVWHDGSAAALPGTQPRRKGRILVASAAVLALVGVGVGIGFGASSLNSNTVAGSGSAVIGQAQNGTGTGGTSNGGTGSNGFGTGSGSTGTGSGSGSTSSSVTGQATSAQSVGVVDINTVLGYQGARAAGTGMILTASGEILTNNHVIDGATSISVTVVSTGKTYTATVVGHDASDDVAVIQLKDASGLSTVSTSTAAAAVGDKVTAVGNAGGLGGTPSAATGTVTAINQSITASDSDGSNSETLTGLIQTDANIQAGDSGGPLYDTAGKVIGMNTAASASNGRATSTTTEGYAITISKALNIAKQIEAGQASSTIHIGETAFLGVGVADSATGGATVSGVIASSPAATAGLVAGDVITAVGGHTVATATSLTTVMSGYHPGDKVALSWTDASGQTHTANVTLIAGPA